MKRSGGGMLVLLLVGFAGCEAERLEGGEAEERTAGVVDSAAPVRAALERFREDIPLAPEGLRGGLGSTAEVVAALDSLLMRVDTAGFERLAVNRAEFAHLYYESSPLSQPPYELPPGLMWFQLQQENRTGVLRLLREFGGSGLGEAELRCPAAPVQQGENQVWGGCRLRRSASEEVRIFGALLERDGTFKVLSFANDF